MKSLGIIFILLLAFLSTVMTEAVHGCNASARAHSLRTSKIVGTVLDKTEARIAGATVKIENSQFSRMTLSDELGGFEIELPAGVYRLTVEMNGFKRLVLSPFRVKAGARESVSIHMEIKEPAGLLKIE
jgi:hypothetical protein